MTRDVVLELDQAGGALPSHSQRVQFNIDPGGILAETFSKVFGKIFRTAHM